MRICLIRHGATAGNLEKRYVGLTDESLTADSVTHLRKARRNYPVVQRVVTSPMKRCIETASLLFPGIPTECAENLRECSFGEFEYRNYQELAGNEAYQRWIDSGGTLAFPGGESRQEFAARSQNAFLENLKEQRSKGTESVAYVVHGGTIMTLMERFCTEERGYFDWQVKNAQGFELELDEQSSGERFLKLIRPLPLEVSVLPKSGIEEVYVVQKNKHLQCGYTTGTCAAAAATAAARMLFEQKICKEVSVTTPNGITLLLETEFPRIGEREASCAVRKFGGDDPDATDGLFIFARVRMEEEQESGTAIRSTEGGTAQEAEARIEIDGGSGVGRVTKTGLDQPVGAAAINRVPRQMIREGVQKICKTYGYTGVLSVLVSVQGGEEIAKRTFNPHLGIEGGISILGTSGIVVPMSEQALIESIRVEMRQKVKNKETYLLITPGNYGRDFVKENGTEESTQEPNALQYLTPICAEHAMKCSNYIGETLDIAMELGVKGILFTAHVGKFVKVSGGIMNTHSAHADCRAELMAAQALRVGADYETVQKILASNTTEEAIGILQEKQLVKQTADELIRRIMFYLQKHCMKQLQTEVVLFSNQYGYLGESDGAAALAKQIAAEQESLCRQAKGEEI